MTGKKLADFRKRALEDEKSFEEMMVRDYKLRFAQISDVRDALLALE